MSLDKNTTLPLEQYLNDFARWNVSGIDEIIIDNCVEKEFENRFGFPYSFPYGRGTPETIAEITENKILAIKKQSQYPHNKNHINVMLQEKAEIDPLTIDKAEREKLTRLNKQLEKLARNMEDQELHNIRKYFDKEVKRLESNTVPIITNFRNAVSQISTNLTKEGFTITNINQINVGTELVNNHNSLLDSNVIREIKLDNINGDSESFIKATRITIPPVVITAELKDTSTIEIEVSDVAWLARTPGLRARAAGYWQDDEFGWTTNCDAIVPVSTHTIDYRGMVKLLQSLNLPALTLPGLWKVNKPDAEQDQEKGQNQDQDNHQGFGR